MRPAHVHDRPDGHRGRREDLRDAVDVRDAELREAYRAAVRARIDWAPDEPNFHVFAVDVRSAGFISFAELEDRPGTRKAARGRCRSRTEPQPTRFNGA